jgi:GcrA cell cycle regulator
MKMGPQHVEIAKELWLQDKSATEIVNYFGGLFTRSQILGKLYRMGIVGNRRSKVLKIQDYKIKRRLKAREATVLKPTVRSDGLPWAKPTPMPTPSDASRRSFNCVSGPSYDLCDLNRTDCRWPINSPGEPNFAYCAAPTMGLEVYCSIHCRIAYNPVR